MAWPIDWDDDTVSDGSALATDSNWNVYNAGAGVPTSDEHDQHDPFNGQVMDMSFDGNGYESYAIYDDAAGSDDYQVSGWLWPDDDAAEGRNGVGFLLRFPNSIVGTAANRDGYRVRVNNADGFEQFTLQLHRVLNGSTTLLTSVTASVGPTWNSNVEAFWGRVKVEQNGSGNPEISVWISTDDTEANEVLEIDAYEDTSGDSVDTGEYAGRYWIRTYGATNAQPFSINYKAELLSAGGFAGSYVKDEGGVKRGIHMANGDTASLKLSDGSRFEQ